MLVWTVNIALALLVLVLGVRAPLRDPYLRADFAAGPIWKRLLALILWMGVLALVWILLRALVGSIIFP